MKLNDAEILKLWDEFILTRNPRIKNVLIMQYIWLVRYVQKQLNLPNHTILSSEDFTNIGILGLSDAIDRFENDRGNKFESYASLRIKGTIQDELRKLDWLSRSTRRKASDYLHANDQLRLAEGREVSQEEIRKKLNVTVEQYESYLLAAAAAKASLSLNESNVIIQDNEEIDILESLSDDDDISTLDSMVNTERLEHITKYLHQLNEKKRLVISLYYYEELTFKEIGTLLNVTESRICQIHTEVLSELKNKMLRYEYA